MNNSFLIYYMAVLVTVTSITAADALAAPKMVPLADKRASAEYLCSSCQGPLFSQGLETYQVPMALYELNRLRLVQAMTNVGAKGMILLQGGSQTTRYDTDHEPVFRQESYFHWAFGVLEEGCYGAIELPSGKTTLFVPQYGIDYEIFCGENSNLDILKGHYGVDQALPIDQLPQFMKEYLDGSDSDNEKLHLLSGLNTDSGNMAMPAHYDGISKHSNQIALDTLFDCIQKCRVYKTKPELEVMRYTNWVSSMAHVEVMRSAQPGMMEYQLESLFQHHTYTHGGCRHMSYTCICACGPNPAILHYGHAGRPNNRLLEDGDLALLDMGAEYHCYASDITCSFPVNGVFTDDQRLVYEAVLDAQIAVMKVLKPGVSWTTMHRTAERAILTKLREGQLLRGDSIDDMLEADLGAIFMPHGLGHLIGLDTHDVGGYAEDAPERSDRPGLNKLRTARVLEETMVLTVEPGCYFIDLLLDMALKNPAQSKFINAERLEDFRGLGGVRLEDDVFITEDGCENLTICPRAVEEVLHVMKGGAWPPKRDVLPALKRSWVERKGGRMVPLEISDAS